MQKEYRIHTKAKFGKGDPGNCSFQNCLKRSEKSLIWGQGDKARNALADCQNLYLTVRELRFLEEILYGVHDCLAAIQFDGYDLENLSRGVEILEKELNERYLPKLPGVPDFVSFPFTPGKTLDKARVEVRELERLYKNYAPNHSENEKALRFLNRSSTFIFWLGWYYHYSDRTKIIRRRADFDLI